jgi:hypothetical protein
MSEAGIPEEVLPILRARSWTPVEGYKKGGGQAAVIEVRHEEKGRGAFRLLKKADAEDIRRFDREVAIVTDPRFRHPNIVNILDVASLGEGYWYISELGKPFDAYWKSLRERVGAGRVVREGVAVIRQLAEGLAPLHEQGVVHRDIKPQNIVVVGSGDQARAVLIDFGIAYQDGEERLTAVDGAVGPRAFAPDVMRTYMEDVPPWLDVFELAQVLIGMVSAGDAKPQWQRPVHWRYVRYPAALDPDLEKRVRAITALCSIEATGPKNARELVTLLDSYFPADEPDDQTPGGSAGYAGVVRGRLRGQADRDVRQAEDAELVAACFPAFEKTASELATDLREIAPELERESIAVNVSIDQSPADRYERLVQLRKEVSTGTLFNMVIGDQPAAFSVALGYFTLLASLGDDRNRVRPEGANVFAFKLSRFTGSSRPFPKRVVFVTIERTGELTLRNAAMKRLRTVTPAEIAALVREWIDDEALWEQLHSESGPVPSPWRIDDAEFEELDGDERAALSLLGSLALEGGRIYGISTNALIERAASGGYDVNGVIGALEGLHRGRLISAERYSRSLPSDVSMLEAGFEVYATAFVPRYRTLVNEVVALIVGGDHSLNVHLEITLGQPRVLVDHILEQLTSHSLIRHREKSSPLIRIDDYRELTEWAGSLGVEPRNGNPKRVAIEAFVAEMEKVRGHDDLATLERGWWEPLREAQRIASESGARDTYVPGVHDDNHRLLQALGRLGFISDEKHPHYVADMNSPEYVQAIADAQAAVEIVYAKVRAALLVTHS